MLVEHVLRLAPEELMEHTLDWVVCLLKGRELVELRVHLTTGGPEVWAVFDFRGAEVKIVKDGMLYDAEAGTPRVREYLDRLEDYLGESIFTAPWLKA